MDRRFFLGTLAGALLAAPLAAEGQQAGKSVRVAIVGSMTTEINKSLEDGLVQLGLAIGRNVSVGRPMFYSTPQQAATIATEVPSSKPDLVVAWGTVGAVAVKKAGTQIPVVFLSVGVPVEIGLVASLAHPGGNMTGVTFEVGPLSTLGWQESATRVHLRPTWPDSPSRSYCLPALGAVRSTRIAGRILRPY
jgi:putative ABC transport system substrate-binding protein